MGPGCTSLSCSVLSEYLFKGSVLDGSFAGVVFADNARRTRIAEFLAAGAHIAKTTFVKQLTSLCEARKQNYEGDETKLQLKAFQKISHKSSIQGPDQLGGDIEIQAPLGHYGKIEPLLCVSLISRWQKLSGFSGSGDQKAR